MLSAAAPAAPVYIAETAPQHTRGSMGILYDLMTTLGIVMASAANIGLKIEGMG